MNWTAGGECGPVGSGDGLPCREVMDQLWEFIDGELTGARTERIREHLDACAACWPHYDFERAFVEFLRRHREQPVPPGLRRRVFETLLEEERGPG